MHNYNTFDNPISDVRFTKQYINSLICRHSIPIFRELYVTGSFLKPRFIKKRKDEVSRYVYEVHGCLFILTPEGAEYISKLKFEPLLYNEEAFISENIYRE